MNAEALPILGESRRDGLQHSPHGRELLGCFLLALHCGEHLVVGAAQ